MAEIIPMTEEQKFQLEIYKLVMNQNAAAEEAFHRAGMGLSRLQLERRGADRTGQFPPRL